MGGVMKKLLVMLCFSIVSVAASAQVFSQNQNVFPKTGAQKQGGASAFSNVTKDAASSRNEFSKVIKAPHRNTNTDAAVERQVAQAQMKQSTTVVSGENEIDHDNPATTVSSERPSYYATDDAYQTCQNVKVCEEWVRQQAQEEIHFQVLSASLVQKEDLHHGRLIVKYVKYQDTQEKVLEEDFDGWKEL